MAPDFRDERLLVSGASLEPAFAMNRSVHGFLPTTLGKRGQICAESA
jgi:hypothetical protein